MTWDPTKACAGCLSELYPLKKSQINNNNSWICPECWDYESEQTRLKGTTNIPNLIYCSFDQGKKS